MYGKLVCIQAYQILTVNESDKERNEIFPQLK